MKEISIGIAFGSGAARGWAHIGVIQKLAELEILPDVVSGTSAGALVGGAYVAGHLNEFEQWLRTLNRLDVAKFFDPRLANGGLIAGRRIIDFLRDRFGDVEIDSLSKRFGAVATDLSAGREVWLQSGSLLDVVRASISIPGIFEPFQLNGTWFVDGGIVNPVPVSLCRALGADIVIAVNVNGHIVNERLAIVGPNSAEKIANHTNGDIIYGSSKNPQVHDWKNRNGHVLSNIRRRKSGKPSLFYVLNRSAGLMQERITRSRLACDPPDMILYPNTKGIGSMDFHRAADAIDSGRDSVHKKKDEILDVIGRLSRREAVSLNNQGS